MVGHAICVMSGFHIRVALLWGILFSSIGQFVSVLVPISRLPRQHSGKESTCQCRRHKRCGFDPWIRKILWRREMTAHSSILAWRIPWTEELGRLQSMGLQRVRHNLATEHALIVSYDPFNFCSVHGNFSFFISNFIKHYSHLLFILLLLLRSVVSDSVRPHGL